jgi:hypothetical protein
MTDPSSTIGIGLTDDKILSPEKRTADDWLGINRWYWRQDRRPILSRNPRAQTEPLLRVASLAKIKPAARISFCDDLSTDIEREISHFRNCSLEKTRRSARGSRFSRMAKLLKELDETFNQLDASDVDALLTHARQPVTRLYAGPALDEPVFRHFARLVDILAQQASAAAAMLTPIPGVSRRGRPQHVFLKDVGSPGSLHRFTLRLLWDIEASGGRLSFDKTRRRGTLVDVYAVLRPLLPPKFIPNILPYSTISRLKALAARAAQLERDYVPQKSL